MAPRLKFYGWGHEGEGLDEAEYARVSRFVAEKLGAEPTPAAPPQASEIALRAPRIQAPASLASVADARSARAAAAYLRQVLPRDRARLCPRFRQRARLRRAAGDRSRHRRIVRLGERRKSRGRSVRRGIVGRGRRRADRRRRLRWRGQPRHAAPEPRARSGRSEPRRAHSGRHSWARDRGGAEAAWLRFAPLSAELRVLDARRLDRHPFGRPFRHALHAYRRSRRKPAHGDARGNHGIAPPAGLGRGPQSRPHDDRLGGLARRDHGSVDAAAGAAALPRRRRVRLPRFLRRRASRARRLAGRALPVEPARHRQPRSGRLRRQFL